MEGMNKELAGCRHPQACAGVRSRPSLRQHFSLRVQSTAAVAAIVERDRLTIEMDHETVWSGGLQRCGQCEINPEADLLWKENLP